MFWRVFKVLPKTSLEPVFTGLLRSWSFPVFQFSGLCGPVLVRSQSFAGPRTGLPNTNENWPDNGEIGPKQWLGHCSGLRNVLFFFVYTFFITNYIFSLYLYIQGGKWWEMAGIQVGWQWLGGNWAHLSLLIVYTTTLLYDIHN